MSCLDHDVLNIWGAGQLLAFSGLDGPMDFAAQLTARTTANGIDVQTPTAVRLEFAPGATRRVFLTGDCFQLDAVRGAVLDCRHLLIEGPCRVLEGVAFQEGNRTLVGPDCQRLRADLDAAIADRRRWLAAQKLPERLTDRQRQTGAKALSVMKTQVCTPTHHVRHRWTTPDRWPHAGLWLWDSAFHAIGWRHVDPVLAREMLDAVFDGQDPDGHIPIRTVPNRTHEYTQPPVLALAASLLPEIDLARWYPLLKAYVEWDLTHRDSDGAGLLEWAIEGNPECRSGESGMDNSPRFDSAVALDAVDFSAFIAHECELLANMAGKLGLKEDVARWTQRHRHLCDQMNRRLWNEKLGLYMDCVAATGQQTDVMAGNGFLPLLCGAPSLDQARRLAEHLRNPRTFGTPVPIASITPGQPQYYRKDMWRGPVWVNLNWLVARGLDRYGMNDLARELRAKTMAEVERWYLEYGVLFEYFDDEGKVPPPRLQRKGQNQPGVHPHEVIHDYGWTSTLYVDLLWSQV